MALRVVGHAFRYIGGVSVGTSVKTLVGFGFTEAELLQADTAIIVVYHADVHYRIDMDSGNPDQYSFFIDSGTMLELEGRYNLLNFRMLTTSSPATVSIALVKW